ncbi:hypothetical protein RRF57_011845 [Xylaria bambusicola]|uniref:Uncharacterized protein n=1 Tax=Xylaria bambusicola TaxID=326684 RepID=A0AAN7UVJ5_9PEZI
MARIVAIWGCNVLTHYDTTPMLTVSTVSAKWRVPHISHFAHFAHFAIMYGEYHDLVAPSVNVEAARGQLIQQYQDEQESGGLAPHHYESCLC